LKDISKNFVEGYWDFVFDHVYGYSKEISETVSSSKNYIILATTNIAMSIKRDFPSTFIIYLDFLTQEELLKRISDRFKPNDHLIKDKILNAETERKKSIFYDMILKNDDPNILYEELKKIIFYK